MKGLWPPFICLAALSHQYRVTSFATRRVLSCPYSPGLRYSFCNAGRFCCDLETISLVIASIAVHVYLLCLQLPISSVRLKTVCSNLNLMNHQ
jgi:hypothetical protein